MLLCELANQFDDPAQKNCGYSVQSSLCCAMFQNKLEEHWSLLLLSLQSCSCKQVFRTKNNEQSYTGGDMDRRSKRASVKVREN